MAIAFARMRIISRSGGGNVMRSAAYNAREALASERTGERFYFSHRDKPAHHELLLPDGAEALFATTEALWQAVQAAEKRVDAQEAKELVLALPDDAEISLEAKIELARSFVQQHFVDQGVAAQLDVHAPHDGEGNWHAHVLITTRYVTAEGLGKKARELNGSFAYGKTNGEDAWGEQWREHQNAAFERMGLDLRVDETGVVPQIHIGPVRLRREDSILLEDARDRVIQNWDALEEPGAVLAAMTRRQASFTEAELDRYLNKQVPDALYRLDLKAAILSDPDVVELRKDGSRAAVRYTSTEVIGEEQAAVSAAENLWVQSSRAIPDPVVAAATLDYHLRPDQAQALAFASEGRGFAIVEGLAGVGKSHAVSAIRAAHEAAGWKTEAIAPTHKVAGAMRADGFAKARTAQSALFMAKNKRVEWDKRTVLVVDEAAMLNSRVLGGLLSEAQARGAKLILVGDDRQLPSIERGGLFKHLKERLGSARLEVIVRQRESWGREMAGQVAKGHMSEALAALDAHKGISWSKDKAASIAGLAADYVEGMWQQPQASRLAFAYTNADVDGLNQAIRTGAKAQGLIHGEALKVASKRGKIEIMAGDRLVFEVTDKARGLDNGAFATVVGVDKQANTLTLKMDDGRDVALDPKGYDGIRHGFAATIHKGQGATVDHAHVLHGKGWRHAAAYVALTRHRDSVTLYAGEAEAGDREQLVRQFKRRDMQEAALSYKAATSQWQARYIGDDPVETFKAEREALRKVSGDNRDEERQAKHDHRMQAAAKAILESTSAQAKAAAEKILPLVRQADARRKAGEQASRPVRDYFAQRSATQRAAYDAPLREKAREQQAKAARRIKGAKSERQQIKALYLGSEIDRLTNGMIRVARQLI